MSPYRVRYGSMFDDQAYQTRTCTVNCVGVMGAGIALEFKKRYPELYRRYRLDCQHGYVLPGMALRYQVDNQSILCFATKDHWRNPTELGWVTSGLDALVRAGDTIGITSLSLAPLGCGHGGLTIEAVEPLIRAAAGRLPYPVELVLGKP